MALRNILNDNHPVLRKRTDEVKNINSGVLRLLNDMRETMKDADGVGLAANQVGVSKRIIIAADGDEIIYELINPCCEEREGDELGIEGCLSIPQTYGEVERASKVVVTALNRDGKPFRLTAEGLLARVLQHEMDHLEGILFTDKALRLIDPADLQGDEES
ncbi:MAG: peptide deformylase [Dethiobacteria bacterium]|nr:peptide deformylase [Bacillota bacterium]MDW7728536.1 peptide deformylase [Bacillota bacterium]